MFTTSSTPALVATLGFAPQVITRSLDYLLQPDVEPLLARVVIIHTTAFQAQEPHWLSFTQFQQYLQQTYSQIKFSYQVISNSEQKPLRDIESPENAEQTFATLFQVIRDLKREGYRLHGLISGGRKIMIVYMMLAAQLLFDADDSLWYLFSQKMTWDPHARTPEGRSEDRLVDIPLVNLATAMPMMHALIVDSENPAMAMRLYQQKASPTQLYRLQQFYQQCEPVDQQILRLAHQGYSQQQIGDQIGLSLPAVNSRISKMADTFYTRIYGRPLRPRPKHIGRKLIEDLEPLLRGLKPA